MDCRGLLWTAVFLTGTQGVPGGSVVINEIHPSPTDKTIREEFVELYNHGSVPVDLSGWVLDGGVHFVFPDDTVLPPGEFLIVAQDPVTVVQRYGDVPTVGPFSGRLDADGEDVILRNPRGEREDEVDFRRGFPWPTVGGDSGFSLEFLHPGLDNSLGGSWRISDPGVTSEPNTLVTDGERWKYLEGTAEASSPTSAWRAVSFNDSAWSEGNLAIGYGEAFLRTTLDMRDRYTSVFLRKTFVVDDAEAIGGLLLEVQYDDGFNAWINGSYVAGANLSSPELPYDGTALSALESTSFESFRLPRPSTYLVTGPNVLSVQLFNASLGGSSDAFLDARLTATSGGGVGPTPGAVNSVFDVRSPPKLRQVRHEPLQPLSGDPVLITVHASDEDGVDQVSLEYQVVDPGAYVRRSDPGYATGWTSVALYDDGTHGDFIAGDGLWTAVIPGSLQQNRRLVRYRLSATDGAGVSVTVPYPDDPQPNFAYFVYDGIPGWRGASQPGVTPVEQFSPETMASLPVYHLIAQEADVINSQYNSSSRNVHFFGTLVYEGVVYDHMEFENRGEYSTYVSGKNKWRLHFQRGHEFQARDNYGQRYREPWRKMNLSAVASPWVPTNRGMAGLDEGVAFRLYDLAETLSPNTNYFHFRVIDEADEAHPTDQYRGDLWGLYMTIEHTDGRFLDERGLPDGNTYKIEGGGGDKRNQGPTQSVDASDYNALKNGYNQAQSIAWWRSNVDLDGYYTFRSVNQAINNHDLREGWNICQYHNPETNLWTVVPWDLDMLYMPVTHWSGVMNFQNALSQQGLLLLEYQSRARELLDLLFASGEIQKLLAEHAAFIDPPGQSLTFVDVDEAMWNYHPRTASGHRGAFYRNPSTHSARGGTITRTLVSADLEGMARWAHDFMVVDYGQDQLASHASDSAIPERPTISSASLPGFPVDGVVLRCGSFRDPQGNGTFGGMRWRVAEVSPRGAPPLDPDNRKLYEVRASWETGELTTFSDEITVPLEVLKIGATYRARVRMKDTSLRWSRWSPPLEFVTTEPTVPFPPQGALRITELHYHPPGGADYEFVELQNLGASALDLTNVAFTDGIEFRFSEGDVTELGPDEFVVVVENRLAFEGRYGGNGILVAGEYSGQLDNGGERIALTCGANATILDFQYDDTWHPSTDGAGYSLTIVDAASPAESWRQPEGWRPSTDVDGSPGGPDGSAPPGGFQRPGDSNQDGIVDISDALSLLLGLFGSGAPPPCDGAFGEGGNRTLLDVDGSADVDLTDAIVILRYLFLQGPPPALGTGCLRIEGCPSACSF